MTSFSLGQSGLVFQPGMKLKIIVHSCQLSNPTVAQVSFGVGIFRNHFLTKMGNAFLHVFTGTRLERVQNANVVLGYF